MNVHARCALERRVVRGLIRHMKKAGWYPHRAFDGESWYKLAGSEKKAMDAVFGVDEISLRFSRDRFGAEHGVLIVLGNDGWDAISDWNYNEGDADGFDAAMNAFFDSAWFKKLESEVA